MITLFAWKVPETATYGCEGNFRRKISVKGDSQTVTVPNPVKGADLKSIILRADTRLRLRLDGYDEIGRPVTVPVADT